MGRKEKQNDGELITALQQGDESAFETLMNRHKQYVLNIIYKFLHDRHAAEDLAQEVFTRVYLKRDSYQPVAQFTTWLYSITSNLCLNYIRDNKKYNVVSLQAFTEEGDSWEPADTTRIIPLNTVDRQELRDLVWQAVQDLPPQQRMAMIMYRFEGKNYREIAKILNVSVSALKSLIFRARSTLSERLQFYINRQ
ncbi:RNA polymerase sigma factor [Planctomycetota bacterium]